MNKEQGWEDYWKDSPEGFNEIMYESTVYFGKQLVKHFPVSPSDSILDYGCGPGFLVDFLEQTKAKIHGMDISENYIKVCQNKFKANSNLSFSVTKSYDFEELRRVILEKKVNKVVILSILQYYQSHQQVEELILALQKIAKEQPFTCVLADILPNNHQFIADVMNLVKNALKDGYSLKFAKFILFAMFSDYRKVKKNGFLTIDYPFFEELGKKYNIKMEKIDDLTIHSSRYNVVVSF
jgi:2-polyprenyl-3-methyl-5-hydroxy-6-metoxy-1,4-benzoquinol methylase